VYNAVYEILLLPRLAEHGPALVIETGDDLLESVDSIEPYVDLEAL
jgi:hypothetical protein